MSADRDSARLSTRNDSARAAFEAAVARFAAHRPHVCEALAGAVEAEPSFAAAIAFSGFAQVLLARRETLVAARRRHAEAVKALATVRPAPAETALVEALGQAIEARFVAAASRLEAHLASDPTDFLAFKLAYSLRFMAGDERGMLAATNRLLPHWSSEVRYFGYFLGCHAFALSEAGRLAEAEATGRRALESAPDDAWAAHAVAHVHETRGLTGDGIVWLQETRPVWSACNNFAFHMAWHLALCHVARGEFGEALAVYDGDVRPVSTDDFRDIANATSLLWRLEQRGCDVGDRWDELHAIARRRQDDTTLVFASLHHLLTCLACDDRATAARIVWNIERRGRSGSGDQAKTAARIGAPLARILLGRDAAIAPCFDLGAIAAALPLIGGSHAQRDVFLRSLASIAAAPAYLAASRQCVA